MRAKFRSSDVVVDEASHGLGPEKPSIQQLEHGRVGSRSCGHGAVWQVSEAGLDDRPSTSNLEA
ncbi:hypothetical protein MOX02_28250 [Methylobacterium oxalidis]|uniref:Uncharacterized protein n=1 Tax=Methylobacterium oxalidis TaxID=944322 RepID=A0A512J450_9HYPH|nr:hypothetical protein MOX02_28250 [Methylobacterium oxalidis]GLS63613.1 hypothetical protein GCM10007888_19940 [Methylobacterium oxalidis]